MVQSREACFFRTFKTKRTSETSAKFSVPVIKHGGMRGVTMCFFSLANLFF